MDVKHLCMGCMSDKGEEQLCPHCGWIEGTMPEVPQHLPPRSVLNHRYLIGRVLGQGGFGITYLAWDQTLNTRLAIKEYLPQAMATRYAGDTTVMPYSSASSKDGFNYGLERFLDEARTLARFSENPHIVSVRDYFSANGTAYLVMAYIDGITFKQYIAERGNRISYDSALTIMSPVMEALEEVHSVGLLHRDISPDNIFITRNNLVKILDFGAARYAIGEQSRSLSVILKAGYAPEEQYRSKGVQGPWTDIYAAAATFYRALTGHVPPEALDRMHEDQLEAPSRLGVDIPPAAEAALLKALSVMGPNRYQTMREFRDSIISASPGAQKIFSPPVQAQAVSGLEASTAPVPGPALDKTAPAPRADEAYPGMNATVPLAQAGGSPVSGGGSPILDKASAGTPPPAAPGPGVTTPLAAQAVAGTMAAGIGETVPIGAGPYGPGSYSPGSYSPVPPGATAYSPDSAGASSSGAWSGSGPAPSPGAAATKKKPLLMVGGALLLILLLAGGGYAVSRMGQDQGTVVKAPVLNHGISGNQQVVLKNDIKGIAISMGVDEATMEPVEIVQQYLSTQSRFNAVVRTTRGLSETITGNWYYLASGKRELMFTYDVNGTGAETLIWFWCEPAPPAPEGPWEFEAVLANGATRSAQFEVVHDPALDVVEKPNITYKPDIYYEPDVYYPPVEVTQDPIEESYDFSQ